MTDPRDLHCARCDARIELRHYDYPQHVRDHIPVVEAAAGPREGYAGHGSHRPGSVCLECEREAAAGPRDEGLDVERLARAMQNVEDELTATNIAYEYAALAAGPRDYKRGPCVHGNPCRESMCVEYGRSEAAAGPRDEGLDVERLARALIPLTREVLYPGDKQAEAWRRKTATNIAYEYAALAKASES